MSFVFQKRNEIFQTDSSTITLMYFNLEFLLLLAYVVFQIFWLLLKKNHQNERGGKKVMVFISQIFWVSENLLKNRERSKRCYSRYRFFEWWLKDRNERGLVEIIAAKQDQKNYRSRNIKSKPRQEVISEKKDEAVLS